MIVREKTGFSFGAEKGISTGYGYYRVGYKVGQILLEWDNIMRLSQSSNPYPLRRNGGRKVQLAKRCLTEKKNIKVLVFLFALAVWETN